MTVGFLTDAELFTLTKRTHASARIRVLKKQGIAFKLDGDGHPVVTWESVNAVSGRVAKKSRPNSEALEKLMESSNGRTTKDRPRASAACDVLPRRVLLSPDRREA